MNPVAVQASRRVRAALAREREALLDHGVNFLIEDSWRSSFWSTDPLRPHYNPRRQYPIGKQLAACAADSSQDALVEAAFALADWQRLRQQKVAREQAASAARARRKVQAAQSPTAEVESRSSLPTVKQAVAELEQRTRLPVDQIRACFRQGRRSAEQQDVRVRVEEAIRALVDFYRFDHPHAGTPQFAQAGKVWRDFVGQDNRRQRNDDVLLEFFPEDEEGDQAFIIDGRAATGYRGGKRLPKIERVLCEALSINRSTLYRSLKSDTELQNYGGVVSDPVSVTPRGPECGQRATPSQLPAWRTCVCA